MTTVTKPYQDFVNNIDVVDAVKINAQINAIYNFLNNPNIDFTNLSTAIYSINALANTLVERDTSLNIAYNFSKSGQNPNLLFGPSFRLGSSGWSGVGTNGFSVPWGQNGEGGFLFNQSSTTGSAVSVQSSKIPVAASVQLTLSGELYSVGVTAGSIQLIVNAYDVNNVALGQIATITATNGQTWTKGSATFTTPANTSYLLVFCYMAASTTNTGAGWRKLKLEAGPVATTFSDDNTLNTVQYGSVLGLAQIISGGFKLQSGQVSITIPTANTPATAAVTFPTAFAATPIVFPSIGFLGSGEAGYTTLQPSSITATGFTARVTSYLAQTVTYNYIALGT